MKSRLVAALITATAVLWCGIGHVRAQLASSEAHLTEQLRRDLNNGWVAFFRNDSATAFVSFDKVLAQAPGSVRARLGRGWAHLMLGRYQDAIDDLSKTIDWTKGDPVADFTIYHRSLAYEFRGTAYLRLEHYDEALADIDVALDIVSGGKVRTAWSTVMVRRAQALLAKGELERANEAARSARLLARSERKADPAGAIMLGLVEARRGKHAAAIEAYREALALKPDNLVAIHAMRLSTNGGMPAEEAGTVALVRLDGNCEPRCPEWIAIQGVIDAEMDARLRSTLSALGGRKVPVFLDSLGGRIPEAEVMAREIRRADLEVVITRTEWSSCGTGDKACPPEGRRLGVPRSAGAMCAGACALVLAGGTRRFVGSSTAVGIHGPSAYARHLPLWNSINADLRWPDGPLVVLPPSGPMPASNEAQVQAVLKGIADHVGAMDIAPRLVEDIRKAPEDKITWLDTSALDATKLRTDAFHGEHLVETRHIRDYEITSSGQATQPDIPPRFMPNDRYDPNRVTFAIKARLARLKCEPGTVDDKWDANARQALQRLAAASREGFLTGAPVRETLYRLQDWEGVACDGRCPSGAAPSGDAPPSQSCRAPEAQTEALPSAGAMSSLEVAVGSDKILLPVPEGYCLLDSTRRVDALMLSLMTSFPATPKLRLVAMVAECGGLKRWRAGDGPLGAYVQYFVDLRYEATPLVDTTQEFVRSACTQLKTSLPLELADTTRSMNERIARATNDIRVYPRAPIGFFDEDGLSCVGVALQNVQSDMGISKLLLETSAIVVVKQRVIYSRRFALYEGHRTVVTRAIEVQRALAGAALRLNAL